MTKLKPDLHFRRDTLARLGLKLSHLRLMAALREHGQISSAAAQMAISQPAASRLALELEGILGAPLYVRHARGVYLTEIGNHLAERAVRVLRELDDTARDITEMSDGQGGSVSIGAVTGASLERVLPVVKQARVTHPRVTVNIMVDTSDVLVEALLAGRLDFYIGRVPANEDPRQFIARTIGQEPVCLVARQDHPLTRMPEVSLRECVKYDWVLQPEGTLLRRGLERYLHQNHVDMPKKILSTSSMLLTLSLIAQTNAIAPLARAVSDFFEGDDGLGTRVARLPVADDLRIEPYGLVMQSARNLSPASQAFFNMLLSQFPAEDLAIYDGLQPIAHL